MPAAALVIAAENLMPALRERVKVDGEVIGFPDTEPIQALQAIMDQRPNLVVLDIDGEAGSDQAAFGIEIRRQGEVLQPCPHLPRRVIEKHEWSRAGIAGVHDQEEVIGRQPRSLLSSPRLWCTEVLSDFMLHDVLRTKRQSVVRD